MNIDYTKKKKYPRDKNTPLEFIPIKRKFEELKEAKTPVLLENNEMKLKQSVVLSIDWVGDRYTKGKVRYIRESVGDTIVDSEEVPYSISYVDIFSGDSKNKMKVIVKGDNPFK